MSEKIQNINQLIGMNLKCTLFEQKKMANKAKKAIIRFEDNELHIESKTIILGTGKQSRTLGYSQMTSANILHNWRDDRVQIQMIGESLNIKGLKKETCQVIVDLINMKISEHHNAKTNSVVNVENKFKDDIVSKLERLSGLKEKGVLSEEEFNDMKKTILKNN